jgi:hypothetical protein
VTPYIIALAALALLLARTRCSLCRQTEKTKCAERRRSLRQKFNNADTDTLDFSCATQPKKNNRKKEKR